MLTPDPCRVTLRSDPDRADRADKRAARFSARLRRLGLRFRRVRYVGLDVYTFATEADAAAARDALTQQARDAARIRASRLSLAAPAVFTADDDLPF